MNKIKIFFVFLILFFWFWNINISTTYSSCTYSTWDSISDFLNNCKPEYVVWNKNSTYKLEWDFKNKINNFLKNLSFVLWVLAVWMIIYAWLLLQFSWWEDEKVKKAKEIIKWVSIWFLFLIWSWALIYVIINFIYSLW